MDKKTFIQFLLVSMVIMTAWSLLMGPRLARMRAEQAPAPPAASNQVEPQEPLKEPTVEQPPAPEKEVDVVRGIPLSNDLLGTSWTNVGAALEQVQLLEYRAPYFVEKDGEKTRPVLTLVKEFQEGYCSDVIEGITFSRGPGHQEEGWSQDVPTADVIYEVVESDNRIVFESALHPWLKVRKTVSIEPGAYNFDVKLEFENRTDSDLQFSYRLRGAAGIERETLQGMSIASAVGWSKGANGYHVAEIAAYKVARTERAAEQAEKNGDQAKSEELLKNLTNESAGLVWAGTVGQYFAALDQPAGPDQIARVESRSITETDILKAQGRWGPGSISPRQERGRAQLARSNVCVIIHFKALELPAGETTARTYRFIAAPEITEALERYGRGMTNALRASSIPGVTWALSLGTISWVNPMMLGILKFFHWIIPNYGIAILLLTVMMKIVLHPLTRKGQVGMHKMQQLQPKIAELRKKLGDDKQKMAQEQMALFKKYGVHPMSGCLPMLLQMPVFIALFVTLRSAVELRQATFVPGWIDDLSGPDTIFHLPFYVPLLNVNQVNVLPFLMLAAWLLNQKFTPKPSDPQAQQQQKMMQFMPFLFTFMLYSLASGLLLYWTASSAFGILEQWFIRRRLAGIKLRPVAEEEARARKGERARPARQKPGFFGRLAQAVEEQTRKSSRARSGKPKKRP